MGFEDPNLISLSSFAETDGTFTIVYVIKAYGSSDADAFLSLQSEFFANDRANLIAPIKSVTIETYLGETDYIIQDGIISVLLYDNIEL